MHMQTHARTHAQDPPFPSRLRARTSSSLASALRPHLQYDVELFQKIESLTGVKMELFPSEQETVLMLMVSSKRSQNGLKLEGGGWRVGSLTWDGELVCPLPHHALLTTPPPPLPPPALLLARPEDMILTLSYDLI